MNFDLAGELAADEIETDTVVGIDDVASAPPERSSERRGVAGLFFAYKCAGAAAERGLPLAEVAAAAHKGIEDTTARISRKGRAAWLGERTIGHLDPGATAYLRFLEALQQAWAAVGLLRTGDQD